MSPQHYTSGQSVITEKAYMLGRGFSPLSKPFLVASFNTLLAGRPACSWALVLHLNAAFFKNTLTYETRLTIQRSQA